MTVRIITGDCREALRGLPDESVHCVVTSPPYWGLRDYGTGQAGIGLEASLAEHIEALRGVFADVRRVLRSDGTLWLNYGDAYCGGGRGGNPGDSEHVKQATNAGSLSVRGKVRRNPLKPKDLLGLPWRLAFALQDDGWWLRSDIIWAKPNPMPESIKDRPTRAHEYVFLMSKAERYWYDADAIKTPISDVSAARLTQPNIDQQQGGPKDDKEGNRSHWRTLRNQREKLIAGEKWLGRHEGYQAVKDALGGANARTVWNIASEPFPEAHFATFPTELAERCIKAGCPVGGTVLDPFGGAGTAGLVADRLQRDAILIELNPEYVAMAERRIKGDAPMFVEVAP